MQVADTWQNVNYTKFILSTTICGRKSAIRILTCVSFFRVRFVRFSTCLHDDYDHERSCAISLQLFWKQTSRFLTIKWLFGSSNCATSQQN